MLYLSRLSTGNCITLSVVQPTRHILYMRTVCFKVKFRMLLRHRQYINYKVTAIDIHKADTMNRVITIYCTKASQSSKMQITKKGKSVLSY